MLLDPSHTTQAGVGIFIKEGENEEPSRGAEGGMEGGREGADVSEGLDGGRGDGGREGRRRGGRGGGFEGVFAGEHLVEAETEAPPVYGEGVALVEEELRGEVFVGTAEGVGAIEV